MECSHMGGSIKWAPNFALALIVMVIGSTQDCQDYADVASGGPLCRCRKEVTFNFQQTESERGRLSHAIMAAIQFRERRKKKEGV